jgi:hypothetical protein
MWHIPSTIIQKCIILVYHGYSNRQGNDDENI